MDTLVKVESSTKRSKTIPEEVDQAFKIVLQKAGERVKTVQNVVLVHTRHSDQTLKRKLMEAYPTVNFYTIDCPKLPTRGGRYTAEDGEKLYQTVHTGLDDLALLLTASLSSKALLVSTDKFIDIVPVNPMNQKSRYTFFTSTAYCDENEGKGLFGVYSTGFDSICE